MYKKTINKFQNIAFMLLDVNDDAGGYILVTRWSEMVCKQASRTQAEPGRIVKQQQEKISPNHAQTSRGRLVDS